MAGLFQKKKKKKPSLIHHSNHLGYSFKVQTVFPVPSNYAIIDPDKKTKLRRQDFPSLSKIQESIPRSIV